MSLLNQVSPFGEAITTEQELRELLATPSEFVVNKVINHLDEHSAHF